MLRDTGNGRVDMNIGTGSRDLHSRTAITMDGKMFCISGNCGSNAIIDF